jgi:hypothetical protein
VLSALGLDDLEQHGFFFTRTAVELQTHEARNVDQRLPTRGVPDRDC